VIELQFETIKLHLSTNQVNHDLVGVPMTMILITNQTIMRYTFTFTKNNVCSSN
jgi:hypothetical protein